MNYFVSYTAITTSGAIANGNISLECVAIDNMATIVNIENKIAEMNGYANVVVMNFRQFDKL